MNALPEFPWDHCPRFNGVEAVQESFDEFYKQIPALSNENEERRHIIPSTFTPELSTSSQKNTLDFAAGDVDKKTVFIDPLLLLQNSDLPKDLQVTGPEDPKIDTIYYRVALSFWIRRKFHDTEGYELNPNLFKYYLKLWKNPEMLNRVRKFILAHEFAHIHHNHTKWRWDFITTVGLTGMLFYCCGVMPLDFAVGMSYTIFYLLFLVRRCFRYSLYTNDEMKADLTAYKLTKDLKAAKKCFKIMDKIESIRWRQTPWYQKINQPLFPEAIFPVSHPSPQERIAYLKELALKA